MYKGRRTIAQQTPGCTAALSSVNVQGMNKNRSHTFEFSIFKKNFQNQGKSLASVVAT